MFTYLTERRLLSFTLYSVLITWALIASFLAIKSSLKKPLVIGIDETLGARVINSTSDLLLSQEPLLLLKEYIENTYNYDEVSFSRKMDQAIRLLSLDLYNQKKAELLALKKRLKTTKLSQSARILDLRKKSEHEYLVNLKLTVKSKAKKSP